MTTGTIDGSDLLLYAGGTAVAHSTSCSVSGKTNFREITTKDSNSRAEFRPTITDWSAAVEGLVAYDDTYGFDELQAAWRNKTALTLKLSTEVTGDSILTGTAYIESIEKGAPNGDNVTYNVSFRGTGDLTPQVVS